MAYRDRYEDRERRWSLRQMDEENWDTGRGSFDRGWRSDYGLSEEDWGDYGEPSYWVYEEWWIVPGPYQGIGPSGYQRSDERILENICERLTWHGQIDASDIEVDVNNGEVSLNGSVDSRRTKRMIEDTIEEIPGIKDIHNRLRLRQREDQMRGSTRGDVEMPGRIQEGIDVSGMVREKVEMPGRIQEGMKVFGMDGGYIGSIKEVRRNDFLVDRSLARDVYVPFSASSRTNGEIVLNIPADQVDKQGWEQPELFGSSEGQ